MRTYILRRFLQMIPLLFGISALSFMLLQLAPGDFLNQMAENPAISPATIDAMLSRIGALREALARAETAEARHESAHANWMTAEKLAASKDSGLRPLLAYY